MSTPLVIRYHVHSDVVILLYINSTPFPVYHCLKATITVYVCLEATAQDIAWVTRAVARTLCT